MLLLTLLESIRCYVLVYSPFQGEELKKVIGAAAYIECSSKTQQVSAFKKP